MVSDVLELPSTERTNSTKPLTSFDSLKLIYLIEIQFLQLWVGLNSDAPHNLGVWKHSDAGLKVIDPFRGTVLLEEMGDFVGMPHFLFVLCLLTANPTWAAVQCFSTVTDCN